MFNDYSITIAVVGGAEPMQSFVEVEQVLHLAARSVGVSINVLRLAADELCAGRYKDVAGFWCIDGQGQIGELQAIEHAREQGLPLLATGAALKSVALEFVRSQLGWQVALHALRIERGSASPEAGPQSVCATRLVAGTYRADVATLHVVAGKRCNQYGLMAGAALTLELSEHPFFIATAQQPQAMGQALRVPPLASALVGACAVHAAYMSRRQRA